MLEPGYAPSEKMFSGGLASMDVTYDFFKQLEDIYTVKSRHLRYLNVVLPEMWQTQIPGGYSRIWERQGWNFRLKSFDPLPAPLKLLFPTKKQLVSWTLIGFVNQLIMEVSPESLGDFLNEYIDNPAARRNLTDLFFGEDLSGPGLKAFGSLVVCAREENRFLDKFMPMLRAFAENDPRYSAVDEELMSLAIEFFREISDFTRYLESDLFMFKRFNKDLKALFRYGVSVEVLGLAGLGSVVELLEKGELLEPERTDQVDEKLELFGDDHFLRRYRAYFEDYIGALTEAGLSTPNYTIRQISGENENFNVIITRTKLPVESIGGGLISILNAENCMLLVGMILEEIEKIARYNRSGRGVKIGIDASISSWGLEGFDCRKPGITGNEKLIYLETSVPYIRKEDGERIDVEVTLRDLPDIATSVLKKRFVEEKVDGFYDERDMVITLLASFINAGRGGILRMLVDHTNKFIEKKMVDLKLEKVSVGEVARRARRERIFKQAIKSTKSINRALKRRTTPGRPD